MSCDQDPSVTCYAIRYEGGLFSVNKPLAPRSVPTANRIQAAFMGE